jgi:hypothetical protein
VNILSGLVKACHIFTRDLHKYQFANNTYFDISIVQVEYILVHYMYCTLCTYYQQYVTKQMRHVHVMIRYIMKTVHVTKGYVKAWCRYKTVSVTEWYSAFKRYCTVHNRI